MMLENVVAKMIFLKMALGNLMVKSAMKQATSCLYLETQTLILGVKLLFLMSI